MTEQPALTPTEREAEEVATYLWGIYARTGGSPKEKRAVALLGDLRELLAREREAREAAESYAGDVEGDLRRSEGRVRKLREALGRIENFPYDVARDGETELRQVKEIAREALVGLPE